MISRLLAAGNAARARSRERIATFFWLNTGKTERVCQHRTRKRQKTTNIDDYLKRKLKNLRQLPKFSRKKKILQSQKMIMQEMAKKNQIYNKKITSNE